MTAGGKPGRVSATLMNTAPGRHFGFFFFYDFAEVCPGALT